MDAAAGQGTIFIQDLDPVTRPGGALEAVVRAREEGLAGGIGITGHGHHVPATHREALRRFRSTRC